MLYVYACKYLHTHDIYDITRLNIICSLYPFYFQTTFQLVTIKCFSISLSISLLCTLILLLLPRRLLSKDHFFVQTFKAYFNFNLKYLKIGAISFVLCMQSSVWAVILLAGSAVDSKLHFRSSMKMMGFLIRLLNVFLNDHFYYFLFILLLASLHLLGCWEFSFGLQMIAL